MATFHTDYLVSIPYGTKLYRTPRTPPLLSGNPPGTGKKRCKSCGFRIRGAGHEEGSHHLSRIRTK